MKKLKDILVVLIFLSIGVSFVVYTFPKPISLMGKGAIINKKGEGKIEEVNISGEISKKPFRKSIFKGEIKIGNETYKNIIYYFNKDDSDAIIYSPSGDKYIKLGKAYNKDNLNNLAIDFEKTEESFIFPAKDVEVGKKLYKELKK